MLALAVVLASQPASASKKRSKRGTTQSSTKSKPDDERSSGDDEGDGDGPAKPKEKPAEPAEPRAPRDASASPALSASSGLPDWREGTGWTVKTVYRKLPVGHVNKDNKPEDVSTPGWSEPTYWSFLVKKVKAGAGITQYLLQVKNKDGGRTALASLYLARYPMGPATDVLALTRGKFYTMMSGQLKPTTRPYVRPGEPPHPVLADDSVIPYDFPALPFQAKAPPGTKETELARTFSITEELDGLKFARDVTQVEYQNTSLDAFVNKELAEYVKSKGWTSPDLSFIEFRRKFDGLKVKQVWSPKLPWYIYSSSDTMRSWLWDLEAPKPRTERDPTESLPAMPTPAPDPSPSAAQD